MALFRRKRNKEHVGDDVRFRISSDDMEHLRTWARTRVGIDGYLEPPTIVNPPSLLLVDLLGEYTRRPVAGWREADAIAKDLHIALYDAEETGYPRRMRERDETLRKQAKREARERLKDQARRHSATDHELQDDSPDNPAR